MIINNQQEPCRDCVKITQFVCDYCEQFVCDDHSDRTYKHRPKDLDLIQCDACFTDIDKFRDHQLTYQAFKADELQKVRDLEWEQFYKKEFGPCQPSSRIV